LLNPSRNDHLGYLGIEANHEGIVPEDMKWLNYPGTKSLVGLCERTDESSGSATSRNVTKTVS
jgi:hypothetical protein